MNALWIATGLITLANIHLMLKTKRIRKMRRDLEDMDYLEFRAKYKRWLK